MGFPHGSGGEESTCNAGDLVAIPLEKGIATHPSILAWKIPWTEKPGGLQAWVRKESDTTEQLTLNLSSPVLYVFVSC